MPDAGRRSFLEFRVQRELDVQRARHDAVLLRRLVTRGRDAQRRPVRIDARMLAEATGWLENYRRLWEQNFSKLDDLLEEMKADQLKEELNG